MKKLKSVIITLLFLYSGTLIAQSEQMTVSLTNPGSPGILQVSLVTGSIHVIGTKTNEVKIKAEVKGEKKESSTRSDGLRRITSNNAFELSAEEKNNTVSVRTGNPNQHIILTIMVPQNFSLKLSTVNGGNIIAENVNGDSEISNVNGGIKLQNISGSAVANTINGSLTANFLTVNKEAPMAFTSLNGTVDVTFPANTKANLKLQSQRGELLSDFDIVVSKGEPEVLRYTDGGMKKIKRSGWTIGSINGGGPEIMLKTMNGDVIIRKSK